MASGVLSREDMFSRSVAALAGTMFLGGCAMLQTGCAGARPPSAEPIHLESVAQAPLAEPQKPRTFVVWSHLPSTDGPAFVSRVVSVDSDGVVPIAEAPEAVVVFQGRAYRIEINSREEPLHECELNGGDPEKVSGQAEVHQGWIVDATSSQSQRLVEPGSTDGANEYEDSVDVVASVGPYVFVETGGYEFACGAHGNTFRSATVFDLRTGKAAQPFSDSELSTIDRGERMVAHEQLSGMDGLLTSSDHLLPEEVSMVDVRPHFDAGRLGIDLLFITAACYACSDGEWGSYTVSASVPAKTLPASMREFAKREPWLVKYEATHPDERIGGVNEIEKASAVSGLASAMHDEALGAKLAFR